MYCNQNKMENKTREKHYLFTIFILHFLIVSKIYKTKKLTITLTYQIYWHSIENNSWQN